MRIAFQNIKAYSTTSGHFGKIRVINKLGRSIPGNLISQIAALSKDIHHQFSCAPLMRLYEDDIDVSLRVAALLRRKVSEHRILKTLIGTKLLQGKDVPLSKGTIPVFGHHHLAVLSFVGMEIAVDISVAELRRANPSFNKLEVQIIISQVDRLSSDLTEIYGNNMWHSLVTRDQDIHLLPKMTYFPKGIEDPKS
jgi:hypothetical protein